MNPIKRRWRLRKISKANTQERAQREIEALKSPHIPHQPHRNK